MNINLDDFEESLIGLTKLSDAERGEKYLVTRDDDALNVYEHLSIGDIEDALDECFERFHLRAGCSEEGRLRAILERVCNLAIHQDR